MKGFTWFRGNKVEEDREGERRDNMKTTAIRRETEGISVCHLQRKDCMR